MSNFSDNMQNQMNHDLQSIESALAPMTEDGMMLSTFSTF